MRSLPGLGRYIAVEALFCLVAASGYQSPSLDTLPLPGRTDCMHGDSGRVTFAACASDMHAGARDPIESG